MSTSARGASEGTARGTRGAGKGHARGKKGASEERARWGASGRSKKG